MTPARRTLQSGRAFTLVELLLAVSLLGVIMVLMTTITNQVQTTYRQTQAKAEQFRTAREAFETVTRKLSQATLNTYWDYDDPQNPTRYRRQSELRFLSGSASALLPGGIETTTHAAFFQAPFGHAEDAKYSGLENLINTWGYFIEFGDDSLIRPSILPSSFPLRHRFRLYELMEPSEDLALYDYTSSTPLVDHSDYNGFEWFQVPLTASPRPARVLAENVVALVFWPKDPEQTSLTSDYAYDTAPGAGTPQSEHQLPPLVQVTMVAIDEASALRLADVHGDNLPGLIQPEWFMDSNEVQYEDDLGLLRRRLSGAFDPAERVNYRVFTSTVSIRGAKWSRD